jgi:uncharacterized protein (TIGR02466 family)
MNILTESSIGEMSEDTFSGELYFPTMVFNITCSDHVALNDYLTNLIYAERDRDQEGIQRSNYKKLGGWHSHNNLHREDAYRPLTDRIHQAGRRISKQLGYNPSKHLQVGTMWSIINAPGSSNKSHIHPGCHWSGVYYVHAPKGAGDIEFTDPRTTHIMNQPSFEKNKQRSKENWTKVQYTPKAGKMLIFPSWLYHGVAPNLSDQSGRDGERVIISFNLSQVG